MLRPEAVLGLCAPLVLGRLSVPSSPMALSGDVGLVEDDCGKLLIALKTPFGLAIEGLLREDVGEGGCDVPGRAITGRSERLTVLPSGAVISVPGGQYVMAMALCSRVRSVLVAMFAIVISPSALAELYGSMGMRMIVSEREAL